MNFLRILFVVLIGFSFVSLSAQSDTICKPLLFKLEGTVKDIVTKNAVKGANVKLSGTDGSIDETKTDSVGFFKFDLKLNTSYSTNITKEGS